MGYNDDTNDYDDVVNGIRYDNNKDYQEGANYIGYEEHTNDNEYANDVRYEDNSNDDDDVNGIRYEDDINDDWGNVNGFGSPYSDTMNDDSNTHMSNEPNRNTGHTIEGQKARWASRGIWNFMDDSKNVVVFISSGQSSKSGVTKVRMKNQ